MFRAPPLEIVDAALFNLSVRFPKPSPMLTAYPVAVLVTAAAPYTSRNSPIPSGTTLTAAAAVAPWKVSVCAESPKATVTFPVVHPGSKLAESKTTSS